jgi:hypothetical protein
MLQILYPYEKSFPSQESNHGHPGTSIIDPTSVPSKYLKHEVT